MTKKHHHQDVHRGEPHKDERDAVREESLKTENEEIEKLKKQVESLQSALTKSELELSQTRESMLRSLERPSNDFKTVSKLFVVLWHQRDIIKR